MYKRQYFGALIQIKLRSRLKSPEAIEDVRQETFTRFFVALRDGRVLRPESLGSYVNSICNNVLLEHYRAGSRLDSLDDEERPREFPAKGTDLLTLSLIHIFQVDAGFSGLSFHQCWIALSTATHSS